MAAFLIETAKALLTFIAVCVGLGVLYLLGRSPARYGAQNRSSSMGRQRRVENSIFKH